MNEGKGRTFKEIKEYVSRAIAEGQAPHAKFLHDYRMECMETILPVLESYLSRFGCPDTYLRSTAMGMGDEILNALCAKGLTEG